MLDEKVQLASHMNGHLGLACTRCALILMALKAPLTKCGTDVL